ncbi:SPFH domain-containing protein [Ruminococcaceae bacterium OttesenSCG-928-D13]|nr:SPFH domain-containing protein [Ruminococcaceae bacterium OttesenSCG-928-D13]
MEERLLQARGGMGVLIVNTLLIILAIAVFVVGVVFLEGGRHVLGAVLLAVGALYGFIIGPILYTGLRVLRPNEAMVLTLFGQYIGTLKGEGFYFVSPFASSMAVPTFASTSAAFNDEVMQVQSTGKGDVAVKVSPTRRKISLKTMTLNNDRQKINDSLGNPIIIGIVVIWRVANTARAMFNVDNYIEYLSIQCDSALRNIVRQYPYDAADDAEAGEKSLRGSSQEIASSLRDAIQEKAEIAGLEIIEARITHLAYAPEIAAAMLQRQQAAAVVDARQLIVEGAVGMVELALERLSEREVVALDEERKAAMVSNLMVVLCAGKDAQPVVNSGSLY